MGWKVEGDGLEGQRLAPQRISQEMRRDGTRAEQQTARERPVQPFDGLAFMRCPAGWDIIGLPIRLSESDVLKIRKRFAPGCEDYFGDRGYRRTSLSGPSITLLGFFRMSAQSTVDQAIPLFGLRPSFQLD
jgi:hypothetical protein